MNTWSRKHRERQTLTFLISASIPLLKLIVFLEANRPLVFFKISYFILSKYSNSYPRALSRYNLFFGIKVTTDINHRRERPR